MRDRTLGVLQGLVRGIGILQLLLGVLIWIGVALTLIPVHMGIGIVFVLSMWGLAILGARARAGAGIVVAVLAWGALTAAFGMTQAQILPGQHHWVIRTLHLLVGIGAMSLAERIGRRIREVRAHGAGAPRTIPA